LAKVIFRHGERVKCPHDPDTRRDLARFAIEQREKLREVRLQLDYSGAPAETCAAAFGECRAGLRASYRELREKMELFSVDLLDKFERHIGRLAAGDHSSELEVGGMNVTRMLRRRDAASGRGIPPKRRRMR
jgi:hypothetical protein